MSKSNKTSNQYITFIKECEIPISLFIVAVVVIIKTFINPASDKEFYQFATHCSNYAGIIAIANIIRKIIKDYFQMKIKLAALSQNSRRKKFKPNSVIKVIRRTSIKKPTPSPRLQYRLLF
jgi:hypothetical protein